MTACDKAQTHFVTPTERTRLTYDELVAFAYDAADFGHCLECGEPCDPTYGEVLCQPCDAEAAIKDAEIEAALGGLAQRIFAEVPGHWRDGLADQAPR